MDFTTEEKRRKEKNHVRSIPNKRDGNSEWVKQQKKGARKKLCFVFLGTIVIPLLEMQVHSSVSYEIFY